MPTSRSDIFWWRRLAGWILRRRGTVRRCEVPCFHVAPRAARERILAEGLDGSTRRFSNVQRPDGVYCWRHLADALDCGWEEDGMVWDVWLFDAGRRPLRADLGEAGAWYVVGGVASEDLVLFGSAPGDRSSLHRAGRLVDSLLGSDRGALFDEYVRRRDELEEVDRPRSAEDRRNPRKAAVGRVG